MGNPLQEILRSQPFIVLDGAFGTEIEKTGFSILDPLWSAVALCSRPDLVQQVHRSYLDAGADVITTASYQATVEGVMEKGYTEEEAVNILQSAVLLAKEERDSFWASHSEPHRVRPLVSVSLSLYGAHLLNGTEYHGKYTVDQITISDFHKKYLAIYAKAEPDLFAFETIPCLMEAKAIREALTGYPDGCAMVAFSCRDGLHTCSGDRISDCAAVLDEAPQIAAIGVNCTAPKYVESLIYEIQKATDKPIVVYPNSGEIYDTEARCWRGTQDAYGDYVKIWYDAGARLIGGCCRTTPDDIRAVRGVMERLREK